MTKQGNIIHTLQEEAWAIFAANLLQALKAFGSKINMASLSFVQFSLLPILHSSHRQHEVNIHMVIKAAHVPCINQHL